MSSSSKPTAIEEGISSATLTLSSMLTCKTCVLEFQPLTVPVCVVNVLSAANVPVTSLRTKFALKSEAAGVDAVVCEGFEAGGHNGRDETTTFTLIPLVKEQVKIPVIAAGGIGTGRGMLAAMVLGADGVQVGSRFAATQESSAHINFKKAIVDVKEGGTSLTLKELAPVRLMKNKFYQEVQELYAQNPSVEELKELLGRARAKKGMFEGNLEKGELEIGQVSALLKNILPASEIISDIVHSYRKAGGNKLGPRFKF